MEITQVRVNEFRQHMQAFTDIVKWSNDVVMMMLCEADCETGGKRWGVYDNTCHNLKRRGMHYYCAHMLVSQYVQGTAEDPTNIKPDARLNVSSKSVGDESLSFRITAMEATTTDFLSTTFYGVNFLKLRQRVGMGAMAI